MSWFEDNVGKVVAAVVAIVISVFAVGWWLTSTSPTTPQSAPTVNQSSSQLPQPGVPSRDPRSGKEPSEFVVQFVEKLNEVNSYLYTQRPGEGEARDIYRQMWEWAELGGLNLRGLSSSGAVVSDSAEKAAPAPFMEITTMEGDVFCAVSGEIVDPTRVSDGSQVLVAQACTELIRG